ncbi:MAG: hypothetical protein J6Y20_04630 [Lachnospiraceae bacterium]|nr:hypothetical protein [Kiritimatiellia bacterium]MBP5461391.1 hypothetical protein [Lachnospiraceae bacterium]
MAHVSRRRVVDYPYFGQFFEKAEPDLTVPLDQREIVERLVWETKCDIQEVSKAANPVLIATFSVFMPFDPNEDIPIRRGMSFSGKMGNIDVSGMVTNVVLSQVGGLVAYVKDYDASDAAL